MLMRNSKRRCSLLYLFYFLLVFGRWNRAKSQEGLSKGKECRFIYRNDEGYITSPNYPNIYPSKQNCSYTVEAKDDQQISLHLEDFVLETSKLCNFDEVSVFDGQDTNAPLLRTYCGRVAPETMFSSGNSITVLFVTDEDGALKGFKIKYKAVKKCYEEFDSNQGQIASPDYPSVYPHNIQCHYVVKVAKDQSVRISFKDFQLENVLYENCFDYVQIAIYRESSWGRFGEVFCSNEAPKDFCVDSKDVMIRFMSDNVVNERGFKATYEIGDIKCDGTRHQKRLKSTESSTMNHQVKASKSIPLYNDNVTATSIAESTGERHRSIEQTRSTINNEVRSETVYNVGDKVRNEETTVGKEFRTILLSASKTSRSRIHSSIQAQIRTKAQGFSHSVTYTTGVVPQKSSVAVSDVTKIEQHKNVYEKPTKRENNSLSTKSMQQRIKPSAYRNIRKTKLSSGLQEETITATRPISMSVTSAIIRKNAKLSVTVTTEPSQAKDRSVDLELNTMAPKKNIERANYSDHIDTSVSTMRTADVGTDRRDRMSVEYHKNTENIKPTSVHEMEYVSFLNSELRTKEITAINQHHHTIDTSAAFPKHNAITSSLRISSSLPTYKALAKHSGTETTPVLEAVGTDVLQSSADFMYQKYSSSEYQREIKPSISAAISNWSKAVHLKMASFQKISPESTGNFVTSKNEKIVSSKTSASPVPLATLYSDQSIGSSVAEHSETRRRIKPLEKPFIRNIAYSTSVKNLASSTSATGSVIKRSIDALEASSAKMLGTATTHVFLSRHYTSTATRSMSIHRYEDVDNHKETRRDKARGSLIQAWIKPSEILFISSPATLSKSPSRPKKFEIAKTSVAEESDVSKHLAVSKALSPSKSAPVTASLSLSPTPREKSDSELSSSKDFEALTINMERHESGNRPKYDSSSKQSVSLLPTASSLMSKKHFQSTSNSLSNNNNPPGSLHSSFSSHTTLLHEDSGSDELKQVKISYSTVKDQTKQVNKLAAKIKVSSSSKAAIKSKALLEKLDSTPQLFNIKDKLQFENRTRLSEEKYTGSTSDVFSRRQVTENLALQKSLQPPEITTLKPEGASQIKSTKTLVSCTKSLIIALPSDTKPMPMNTLPKNDFILLSEASSDHKKSTSSAFTVLDSIESFGNKKTDQLLRSITASPTGSKEVLFTSGTAKVKASSSYNSKIKPTIVEKGRRATINLGHKHIVSLSPVLKHSAATASASFSAKHASVFSTKQSPLGKQDNFVAGSAFAKQIRLATRNSSRKYMVGQTDMKSVSESKTFAASPSISTARTSSFMILSSSSKTDKSFVEHELNKEAGTTLKKNQFDKPASTEKVSFSSHFDSTVLPEVVSSLIYKDLEMSSRYKYPSKSKDVFISDNILNRKSNGMQSIIQPTVYLPPKKSLAEIRDSVLYSKITDDFKTTVDFLPVESTSSLKQDIRPTQSMYFIENDKEDSDLFSSKILKTKQNFSLVKSSEGTSYSLLPSGISSPHFFATSSVLPESSSRTNPQSSKIHQKKLSSSLQGKIKTTDTSPKTKIAFTSNVERWNILQSHSLSSSLTRSNISRTKSSSIAATSLQSSLKSSLPEVTNKGTTSSASLNNTPLSSTRSTMSTTKSSSLAATLTSSFPKLLDKGTTSLANLKTTLFESKLRIDQHETSKPTKKTMDKPLLEKAAQTATSINQGKSKKFSLVIENVFQTTISSHLDYPAVSSVVAAKEKKECSNHFIPNIEEIEESENLKKKINEIQQLKMKRIIAVRWPYNGYLGRIGFLHKGFVIQTIDDRLWYNHVNEADETIYIIKLESLQMLHKAVKVTHSQTVDDMTLGTHIHAWGMKIGMYFNHCQDGSE